MPLDPITAGLELAKGVGDIVSRFIPDKNEAMKAQLAMEAKIVDAFNAVQQGQIEVNQVEAANSNLFVSGWRPFIGWVCGAAFAWNYLLQPVCTWIMNASGHPMALMTIPSQDMMSVLLGMLGLGAMKTYEKQQEIEPPDHTYTETKQVRKALPIHPPL